VKQQNMYGVFLTEIGCVLFCRF